MENIPDTEQWLLQGQCKKCRRAKHCTKPCTANKKNRQKIIGKAASKIIPPGVMEILNNFNPY